MPYNIHLVRYPKSHQVWGTFLAERGKVAARVGKRAVMCSWAGDAITALGLIVVLPILSSVGFVFLEGRAKNARDLPSSL